MRYKLNTFEDQLRRKTAGIVILHAVQAYFLTLLSAGILVYAAFILAYSVPPQFFRIHLPKWLVWNLLLALPFIVAAFIAWQQSKDLSKMTLKLEDQFPELQDRLHTMVELSSRREEIEKNQFSKIFVESLERDMRGVLSRFDFREAFPLKKMFMTVVFLFLFCAAGSIHAFIQKDFFSVGYSNLTAPWKLDARLMSPMHMFDRFEIKVIPGNAEISRGSSLEIMATAVNHQADKAEIFFKTQNDKSWQSIGMEGKNGHEFKATLMNLMESGTYYVKIDHVESPVFQIKVYQDLHLERVHWRLEFPSYMNLTEQSRQGWKDKLTVPKGTKIHLELYLNQPVKEGWILEQNKKAFELKSKSSKSLMTSFEAMNDMVLSLDIRNAGGDTLMAPTVWVQTLPDLPPYLEVLEPQLHNYVFPTQEIPFEISVNDDYALKSVTLVLRYKEREERIEWLGEQEAGKSEQVVIKPTLKLEKYHLESKDLVFAYIEVKDSLGDKDPTHIVRSQAFVFLIRDYVEQYKINLPASTEPSMRQLFEDILVEQEKIMTDTWELISNPPFEGPKGWENSEDSSMGDKQ